MFLGCSKLFTSAGDSDARAGSKTCLTKITLTFRAVFPWPQPPSLSTESRKTLFSLVQRFSDLPAPPHYLPHQPHHASPSNPPSPAQVAYPITLALYCSDINIYLSIYISIRQIQLSLTDLHIHAEEKAAATSSYFITDQPTVFLRVPKTPRPRD